MNHIAQLIPALLILIIYGLFYGVTKLLITHNKLKKRKSPFTGNFLRSPGEWLRERLDDVNIDLNVYLLSAFIFPLVFYSGILSQAYFGGRTPSAPFILIIIFLTAAFEAYFIFKLVKLINMRRKLRLGYEGELAVGQELHLNGNCT